MDIVNGVLYSDEIEGNVSLSLKEGEADKLRNLLLNKRSKLRSCTGTILGNVNSEMCEELEFYDSLIKKLDDLTTKKHLFVSASEQKSRDTYTKRSKYLQKLSQSHHNYSDLSIKDGSRIISYRNVYTGECIEEKYLSANRFLRMDGLKTDKIEILYDEFSGINTKLLEDVIVMKNNLDVRNKR